MRYAAWLAAAGTLAAVPAAAQSLASRVNAVRDGTVQISFAARPGVCGDGRGSVWIQDSEKVFRSGDRGFVCVAGPVRVTIGRSESQSVSVRKCVACRPRSMSAPDTDLGEVPAPEAARFLVDLARKIGGNSAGEAVSAASFADGVNLSPELRQLIRDEDATLEARKQALFWLGQGDYPTTDLVAVYATLKPYSLREHYTFVISQRHDDDAALDKLIDIARRDSDSGVRKQAMFWLGQSKDPKAIKFFRDALLP